jgi:hypothetical protein
MEIRDEKSNLNWPTAIIRNGPRTTSRAPAPPRKFILTLSRIPKNQARPARSPGKSAIGKGERLSEKAMSGFDGFHFIKRRAKDAALPYSTCCHTFALPASPTVSRTNRPVGFQCITHLGKARLRNLWAGSAPQLRTAIEIHRAKGGDRLRCTRSSSPLRGLVVSLAIVKDRWKDEFYCTRASNLPPISR